MLLNAKMQARERAELQAVWPVTAREEPLDPRRPADDLAAVLRS